MRYVIKAKEIYLDNEILHDGGVLVEDGIIREINPQDASCETLDFKGLKLLPGLIDIHVHGGGGFDCMDMSYEAVNGLSLHKIKEGVTTFCPTTVTSTMAKTKRVIFEINGAMAKGVDGAKIAGMFLEGPYLNEKYKGAHPKELIRSIRLDEIKELTEAGGIISMAIAPDKDGAEEAIQYLTANGIYARIGHSGATYMETVAAIDAGARIAIHTFNAMSGFAHREAGMAGAVMLDDRIYAELICDFVHVCPEAVKILYRCKGAEKIVLVTDCMSAGGMPDGKYRLGELAVTVENAVARIADGSIAGSTLRLIDGVKSITSVGVPLLEAVNMASANPARAIGIFDQAGSIAVGKRADFAAIDEGYNIKSVIVDGVEKYA